MEGAQYRELGLTYRRRPGVEEAIELIVPHAGYVYSGQVAAYAYSLLKNSKKQKIILLGPSHTAYFNDVAADINDYWETPLGKVKIMQNNFPKLEEAHINEHCLEVQIPFLQKTLENFEILPLVVGDINPKEISKKIKIVANNFSERAIEKLEKSKTKFLKINEEIKINPDAKNLRILK